MEEKKRVEPITLKFKDGKKYTLEFSRETVCEAEEDGFKRQDVLDKLMTRVPQLFYFAFKMHHEDITREETDSILYNDLGGMTPQVMDRLTDLFNSPYDSLINSTGEVKNANLTILM